MENFGLETFCDLVPFRDLPTLILNGHTSGKFQTGHTGWGTPQRL